MKSKSQKKTTKKRPLQRVVFLAIFIGASIFMLLLNTLSLIQNVRGIFRNFKREARHEATYALSMLDMEYIEKLFKDVQETYYNTPEDIRHDQYGDEYQNLIRPFASTPEYAAARKVLNNCQVHADLNNIGLFFLDQENKRFVIVLDGDLPERVTMPGEWISDENGKSYSYDEIMNVTSSEWYLKVAYAKRSGWAGGDFIELKGQDGKPLGFVSVDIKMERFITHLARYTRVYAFSLLIVIAFTAFLISLYLKRRIIGPLDKLADAAKNYIARDKVSDLETATSFFSSLDISTGDELEELKDTMAEMEADIARTMRRIRQVTTEQERLKRQQERISTELDIAKQIQIDALPSVFPDRPEFDIYASMRPAKEVGGDFYDFFLIDLDHLGLVIADVSGKGVPAALFMMISKQILKNKALFGGTPAQVLTYVNTQLSENNDNAMFVTIWFGILTISTGEVIAASAGHEYPFITDDSGEYKLYEDPHGIPCGVMDGMVYDDYSFRLKPGSQLFLYTDGVAEANNPNKELFGTERTQAALNIHKELSPKEQIENMSKEIKAFAGDCEQFDDITMLCLRYNGPGTE